MDLIDCRGTHGLPCTDKIRIDGAVRFLFVTHHQPLSAASTVDAAFEEMWVFEVALAVQAGSENGLHFIPRFDANQRFMTAGMLHPFIGYDAFVIWVD